MKTTCPECSTPTGWFEDPRYRRGFLGHYRCAACGYVGPLIELLRKADAEELAELLEP